MVNRPPYGTPNNNDVYTPQNEAWLAGLRYAKKNVYIQSPTLNAEPILKEILNACERGVDVFAFICIGYNDAGELLPMQGGTNEMISHALHQSLSPEGLKHLHYHFYLHALPTVVIMAEGSSASPPAESPPARSPPAASPPATAAPQDFENEHLPVESDESDIDSGFGSDTASSTTSILDSIRDYRVLNDQFPSAEVIGTDLSPTQPSFVPPNLHFELDDAQLDWTFNDGTFDYVHLRCLFGAISNWPKFYSDAFRTIKPGGWIEQVEINIQIVSDDGTVGEDHVLTGWAKPFFKAGDLLGKSIRTLDQTKELMENAGFTNVVQRNYKVPIGAWSSDPKLKELGRWSLLFCLSGMESWAMYMLTSVLNWKLEDVQVYLAEVKAAFLDKKNHGYYVVT
ncbi:hypothetical protein VE02_10056 [Pseudogymnoascus sp. 03VT05]|nr:hypothetical protein VE02_10056 [Pseudogymnoascus sp. 03VT05]